MLKSICVISQGYPTPEHPYFTFVEELVCAISKFGVKVVVISPQSLTSHLFRRSLAHPIFREYNVSNGESIKVYQPWMITVPFRFLKMNDWLFTFFVNRQFRKLKIHPDAIYSHFWNNGLYISDAVIKTGIPLFVASGEGNFDDLQEIYTSAKYKRMSKIVKGVICVSRHTLNWSCKLGLTIKDRCIVLPNSIDATKFYKTDKLSLRHKYRIKEDAFIVIFVGSFINRKGSNRLSDAIKLLNDKTIYSFFIGSPQGKENLFPTCEGVLFEGKINHEVLPDYMNMADVFVLPTLNEGCCNAIVEALSCGLPIISSDRPFNHDILDKTNSILVDPLNVNEIADAINKLRYDTGLRESLAKGALERAKSLHINQRAKKIIEFIESKL